MKKLFFLFLFIHSWNNCLAQKVQIGFYVPIDVPDKAVMPSMQTNVGLGFSIGYRPIFGFPMITELKTSFGGYASKSKSSQSPLYDYYDLTTVNSTFKSKFNKYLLGTKFLIGRDFRTIRGYITPQIGLASFKTSNSYKFNDPNNETQESRKIVQRDLTSVYGIEIGTEIILNDLFSKIQGDFQHRITISASFLQGFNRISYTNVKNVFDVNMVENNEEFITNPSFVYLPNDYIYENYMTEIYRTKLSAWGLNVGYIINISGWEDE